MTTKLHVCKSSSCKGLGSDKLIRDLEELCAGSSGCEAVNGTCLDHCGRGPNVKVQSGSGSKVIEGVKTFKDMRNLLEKTAGAKIKKLDWQISEMKYEARRAKGPDRLAKVEKGLKALGGEEKASKEPKLAASLFAFRAEEALRSGGDAEAALRDARQAYALWKGFAPAYVASAMALFRLGKADEARQEMLRLEDAPFGTPAAEDRRALMKEAERNPPKQAEKEEEKPGKDSEQSGKDPPKDPPTAAAAKPAAAPKEKPKPKTKPKSAPKAEPKKDPPTTGGASSKTGAKASAPTSPRPPPAELVVEEEDELPMTRVQTYMSTVPDDRSPGGRSSTKETGFHMLSDFESDRTEEQRPLVYVPAPRSEALDRKKLHPKGRRWIISL